MEVRITDIRVLRGQKATRAFVYLEIDGVTIRDFRVMQSKEKPYVKNPFSTYKDYEGNLTFREIITLPATVQTEAHALILSAYFCRLRENEHGKRE